jgi:hypothetical protein
LPSALDAKSIETANSATQTDRVSWRIWEESSKFKWKILCRFQVRPISMGQDVFTR